MLASFKKKYALSDKGMTSVFQGTVATAVANLIIMAGMGALYLAMQGLVGALTGTGELPGIAGFALGLVVFAAALYVANRFQYAYTYGVFYAESAHQREALAEHLRKIPLSFFGRRDLADLTETILGDVAAMEHAYSHVMGELFGALASSAIVFVACLFYDWQLALAAFWSVPVAMALLFATRPVMAPIYAQVRAGNVAVSEKIQETLDCVREIRATNQEEHYLEGLNAKVDEVERANAKGEVINGLIVNLAFVILRLGIPTTLIVGASKVAAGTADFMLMFMFLLVVSRIYAPFDQCLMLVSELFACQASAKRIREVMEEPLAEGTTSYEPVGHDVAFDHVGFSYGDAAGESVLADVSFTASEGEVTALVGPSGSGKSTCARLAARLWDATSGTVSVGGVDVATVDPETLLGDYAVVFQDVLLFDDTVMGNIRLGRRDATDEEVLAAAAAANCDEFVSRMPEGYNTVIGENGSRLSGGERQRISIARALLKDAPIVLLDEATASLDVENETQVQAALSRLLAGKTVIVIAHRMRTVQAADKVVVLKDGRVAEQGSPVELLAKGGEFAHMVELQSSSASWAL